MGNRVKGDTGITGQAMKWKAAGVRAGGSGQVAMVEGCNGVCTVPACGGKGVGCLCTLVTRAGSETISFYKKQHYTGRPATVIKITPTTIHKKRPQKKTAVHSMHGP